MKIPFFKNTLTNYFSMFIRLVQGILVTRWMIAELGKEQYGLWSLLWGFFSFALLLDLGFGVTAQKATATELWKKDLDQYNRTISSIFFAHTMMSFVIIPATLIGAVYVRVLFHLPDSVTDLSFYRTCLILSGLSAAVVFPLGVFPEILVGLQKLYVRNYIIIVSKLLELVGVLLILVYCRSLIVLIIFVMAVMGLTQVAMLIAVYRTIPGLKIRIGFDLAAFRAMFSFSSSAYLISIGRLLWERGTIMLVSLFCGLVPVGRFQLGSRLPFLVQQLALPYVENISPISALLHARKRQKNLSRILYHLVRWINFFAAGVTVGLIILAPEMIKLLFNVESDRVVLICRLMALLVYGTLVFRVVPEKFLFMAEEHRFLAQTLLVESIVFIVATVGILQFYPSELAVVIAMLLTKALTTALLIAPKFFRMNRISLRKFIVQAVFGPIAMALSAGFFYWLLRQIFRHCEMQLVITIGAAGLGLLFYMFSLYFVAFNPFERNQTRKLLKKLTKKFRKA